MGDARPAGPPPALRPTLRLARLTAIGAALLLFAPFLPGATWLVVALDGALLAAFVVEGARLRRVVRLDVAREIPLRFAAGRTSEVRLALRSRTPLRLRVRLVDGLPPEFDYEPGREELLLAPWGEADAWYRVRPRRRGGHRFGALWWEAEGPLGLAAVRGRAPLVAEARVDPDLGPLRRLGLVARPRDLAEQGLRKLRREGSGDEFEQLRDYVPDDDYRSIAWKATARRHRPITGVRVAERHQRVMLAIDCGRSMAGMSGERSRLDLALEAALTLAGLALRLGDQVGLVVFSSAVRGLVPPRGGAAQLARLVAALYAVEAEPVFVDYRGLARELAARAMRRGLVVIYTDLIDEASSRPLVDAARLLARRHATVVVAPSDPVVLAAAQAGAGSLEDVMRTLVAREALEERRARIEVVRRLGIDVVDAPAVALATAGVNRYLELKRQRAIG